MLFAINSIERKSFVFTFSFKIQFKKEKEKENKREKLQKLRKKGIKSTLVLHFKSDIKKKNNRTILNSLCSNLFSFIKNCVQAIKFGVNYIIG